MKLEFPLQKKLTLAALAILIVADVFLALYSSQSDTKASRAELAAQKAQMKLLKADINRALAIQRSMPQTRADCDRFENSLHSSTAGYSAVSDELTEVAARSGLQIASLGFHSKELSGRNMVELELEASVNGDYKGVVRFLNGLQRSKGIYIIDGLTLTPDQPGQGIPSSLHVSLHLRSLFRNAA